MSREEVIKADVPNGLRFTGYGTVLVRELVLSSQVVRCKRERWVTPNGKTIIAPLPDGIRGSFGPALRRFAWSCMHKAG